MTTFLFLLAVVILVLLNAFFVAAEFAMVKIRPTRLIFLEENHPFRGKILVKVQQSLDAYLSACQLGITLASLGLGWIGEPAIADLLTPAFHWLGLFSHRLVEFISFILAFMILSFLHIVIGELMPKSFAIRQSESVSLWTALPLYYFYWFMYPIIWSLNSCSNWLLRLCKLDIIHPSEQYFSSEELKLVLNTSREYGELSPQESSILSHTLELSELYAMDVMRSYDEMIVLNNPTDKQTILNTTDTYHYSRYPVYDTKQKKIIGLVHVKDLQSLLHQMSDDTPFDLKPITRVIPKVSYHLPALALLRQFQSGVPHFALVNNRQNVTIGFVTLDNLLHLVIGVIKDEFHKTRDAWIPHEDGSFTVTGDCPIHALERALNQDISVEESEEESVSTVAGLIMHTLDSVPKTGDKIELPEFNAIIEKMQRARIMQVRIWPRKNKVPH